MKFYSCEACLEKQRKIDQLLEENKRLKDQLRYRQDKQKQGFFGSSTPSAQLPVKTNSDPEQQSQRGGAQKGHPGHGRKGFDGNDASRIVDVDLEPICPACGRAMQDKGFRRRSVLEIPPPIRNLFCFGYEKGIARIAKGLFRLRHPLYSRRLYSAINSPPVSSSCTICMESP